MNVELVLLAPMIALMHTPTRLEDAARNAPEAVKEAYGDEALRRWRDTLDEFLLVPQKPGDAAADDGEDDEEAKEPLRKKRRMLNPYEQRMVQLGERLGDYILAKHPGVERFLKGLDPRLDMSLLVAYDGSDHESFTLPLLEDPTDDVLAKNSFAWLFHTARESDRAHILNGLKAKFPRTKVQHAVAVNNDPKSRRQAGVTIHWWPNVGTHCHEKTEHVIGLTLFY